MKQSDVIWAVVTLPEAAEIWKLSRSTIVWSIWRDRVAARKANGAWLLSAEDMKAEFGIPKGVQNEG